MGREAAEAKLQAARGVISACRTARGFRASTRSYPELWVRDLVYSERAVLEMGHAGSVRAHLESVLALQRRSGQLPTAVASGLRRALNQRYHFWTCDTEMLFVIGAHVYAEAAGDEGFLESAKEKLGMCVRFVEGRRDGHGLIPGMDWRDAMIWYRGRCLLANQALLATMYASLGEKEKAEAVREAARLHFAPPGGGAWADAVWWEGGELRRDFHFDSLGHALAVLDGTLKPEEALEGFGRASTPFGVLNMSPARDAARRRALASLADVNAFVRNGAVLRNKPGSYQNSTVWPFVEAKVAEALAAMGEGQRAREVYERAIGREGFYEWYDPSTGEPHGSAGQLWTAAGLLSMSKVCP